MGEWALSPSPHEPNPDWGRQPFPPPPPPSQATHAPGPGTYVDDAGLVVASLLGRVHVDPVSEADADARPTVSVRRAGAAAVALKPGNVVTCKVRVMSCCVCAVIRV